MVDAQPETYTVEVLRSWKAEHESWVEAVTADVRGAAPWTAIVQEEGRWIDVAEAEGALGPGNRVASLVELRNNVELDGWDEAARRESRTAEFTVASTLPERRRFAVFSLGRIPLAVQLGYVLGDRVRAELFHYDRDRGSWRWETDAAAGGAVSWAVSECADGARDEAAIRVSLSAEIRPETTARCGVEIDIRVAEPSVRWLRTPGQLAELGRVYGEALGEARRRGCGRVHLFYAGPAAGAVAFGRAYNRRMNPELAVYEYQRRGSPSYEQVLVLNR